jgi:hypothetical protein
VKVEAGQARYLNFACHGLIDDRTPVRVGTGVDLA